MIKLNDKINVEKLARELAAAGLPICGVREVEPYVDYMREPTEAEKKTADEIIARHTPEDDAEPTVKEELMAMKVVINGLTNPGEPATVEEVDLLVKTGWLTEEQGTIAKAEAK